MDRSSGQKIAGTFKWSEDFDIKRLVDQDSSGEKGSRRSHTRRSREDFRVIVITVQSIVSPKISARLESTGESDQPHRWVHWVRRKTTRAKSEPPLIDSLGNVVTRDQHQQFCDRRFTLSRRRNYPVDHQ